MGIVIVGSGNVATHLGLALSKAGETIDQVYSRDLKNAQTLALKIGAKAVANLSEISLSADIYLVAVKDEAIAEVSVRLNEVKGVVAHTSGSTSLNVFSSELKNFGVFYPLQTFSKHREIDFVKVPICVEANKAFGLDVLKDLAWKLSHNVYQINSEERKALHIAAVFAGNFSNHLYALAAGILKENSLTFELLKPLITETAAKVMDNAPSTVQTGPASRRDEVTIQSHLDWLVNSPNLQKVYETLSESIKLKCK